MAESRILVLLADDEALIRAVMQEALESGGYAVLEASDGNEALAILEDRHAELSGFVTDIRLGPGPNGWEAGHRARELNSQIAVVYITGDSADAWPSSGVPNSLVLQKPFASAQLVTAISTLVNEANAVSASAAPKQTTQDEGPDRRPADSSGA